MHDVPEEYDAPYARTYYPATLDKRDARKIHVVERAVIKNLEMRVGPRMIERKVAGSVAWKVVVVLRTDILRCIQAPSTFVVPSSMTTGPSNSLSTVTLTIVSKPSTSSMRSKAAPNASKSRGEAPPDSS